MLVWIRRSTRELPPIRRELSRLSAGQATGADGRGGATETGILFANFVEATLGFDGRRAETRKLGQAGEPF